MPADTIIIPGESLGAYARALLEAVGVPSASARVVTESLVASNLRGVDSHGVQLLPYYIDQIKDQNIDIHATGRVVSENGACVAYDGQNGIGQVIAGICCDHAIRLARAHGLGLVVARESNHFGACAWWAQKMCAAGMIGVVMCNSTPLVAPWQGKEKRLGTNPICMAVPGPNSWLLDMATTTVALNKIYKAMLSGQKTIPPDWAMDAEGNATTDTDAALAGLPMPLGGYKGTGLAMMAEILCGVLSGGAMSTELGGIRVKDRHMRVSHCCLALDVARFMPVEDFAARMEWLRATIKSTAPAPGYDEVLMAGEPEWRAEVERRREGIPLDRGVWNQLTDLAARLNVPAPLS